MDVHRCLQLALCLHQRLSVPDTLHPVSPAAAAPSRGIIILHPWAKLGGSMEDPTVLYNFMCVRGRMHANCNVSPRLARPN